MTMVPATKISKQPHLYFYGGCGVASDVMTRFAADGCTPPASGYGGYTNNINQNTITTTNDDVIVANINGNATNTATNGVLLGSDLGIGHPNSSSYTSHYNNNNNNNLILMADEEQHSRTSNSTSVNDDGDNQPGSIKERDDTSTPPTSDHQRGSSSNSWLQLGLGTTSTTFEQHQQRPTEVLTTPFEQHQQRTTAHHQMGGGGSGGGGLMLELNLGGGGGSTGIIPQQRLDFTSSSGFFAAEASVVGSANFLLPPPPPPPHHHPIFPLIPPPPPQSQLSSYYPPPFLISDHYFQQQQQQIGIGWGFVNPQRTVVSAGCSSSLSPSSSSSMLPSQGSFLTRPSADALDSESRIIHPPPRRPHSGIWFALQASPHQSKEPFLPQVSKSFLRIKDGRMTVRLVMKYVANKLGLDSESEVEIRCRGQEVVPYLTLQHVRDNIWSPRDAAVTLHPDSSTTDHLMILHYGRSSTSPI